MKGKARIVIHFVSGCCPLFELQSWSFDKKKWYVTTTSITTEAIMCWVDRYYPGQLLPILPCVHNSDGSIALF